VRPCADVATIRDGLPVVVAGEILVRQKPGSAEGELLTAIEDETDVDQGILWPDRSRDPVPDVMSAPMVSAYRQMR
jgi:error-prone DNA polymerase